MKNKVAVLLALALWIGPASATVLVAPVGWETQWSSHRPEGDWLFGQAVAASDEGFVVSSAGPQGTVGSVILFRSMDDGTFEEIHLTPTGAAGDPTYGRSVAMDGLDVVVGAPTSFSDAPRVYFFEYEGGGTWTEHVLVPDFPAKVRNFGWTVDVFDGRVAVGSVGAEAVLFSRDATGTWDVEHFGTYHFLTEFGQSVALDSGMLIVGAERTNSYEGAVHVYRPDGMGGWSEEVLRPPAGEEPGRFGHSLAVDGDTIVVGAPRADAPNAGHAGSVFVYERDAAGGWKSTMLTPRHREQSQHFGHAVALQDGIVAVGVPNDRRGESTPGAAWVFERSATGDWRGGRIDASDASDRDRFGHSISLGGDALMVGAPEADAIDPSQPQAGEAYRYDLALDTDMDGLLDYREIALYGTEPLLVDTDLDGLWDGAEVFSHGSDPTDPDSDGDCFLDGLEATLGSDPTDRRSVPHPIDVLPRPGPAAPCNQVPIVR